MEFTINSREFLSIMGNVTINSREFPKYYE